VSTTGVLSGKTVVAVAVGYAHNLALCSDGSVVTWGSNSWGQLGDNSTTSRSEPVEVVTTGALSGKTVVAVAAGTAHSLALCSDGSIAAWGYNSNGELGNNSTLSSKVPVAVSSSTLRDAERFVAAFCGFHSGYNLGLVASPPTPVVASLPAINITKTGATLRGSVDPNGNPTTASFEYGLGTNYGNSVSVSISQNGGVGAQDVSSNLSGLTPGTVYHYRLTASNAAGAVGSADGVFTTLLEVSATYQSASDVPVTASSVLAAGGTFSAVLGFAPLAGTNLTVVKNTGLTFINGTLSNLAQGQLLTLNYGGIDYQFVANYYGGSGNDLVLQWAGTRPVAWGLNSNGQLGDNSTTNRLVPVNVFATGALTGKTVVAAAAGGAHSLALCSDGTVAAWGANGSGQLGNNSTTSDSVPVAVSATGFLSGKAVIAVAAGSSHSLALCSDGTVAAWGLNNFGQLGNNSIFNSYSSVPVAVNTAGALSGKSVVAVAAGSSHSLALCSDGTVAAWGDNFYGQLGNNSTSSSLVPVLVNVAGVLAGKTVVAVAAGSAHSLALCSDGTVAAWGSNISGQLGNSSPATRLVPANVFSTGVLAGKAVTAVAAGSSHSLALCSDGTVAAWGDNFYGQLGNNSTTRSMAPVLVSTSAVLSAKTVVAVTAGGNHTLARCSDGTVATWGRNSSGQLGNDGTTHSTVPVAMSSSSLAIGESFTVALGGSMSSHNLGLIASPPAPVVATLSATNLTSDSVTLNGTVNAVNGNASPSFDYGLDTTYGSTVSGTPTPVLGNTGTAVSAGLVNLVPNTTYHYRVHATNAGGTTSGSDLTFTTLPDTTGPIAGTMTLTPASPVNAGIAPTVTFANWTDPSPPLTYSVLIDDVIVSSQGASASRDMAGFATAGLHTLKGRIYDALGNFTEVTQSFTVIATQEDWRKFHFGTTQNVGDAADQADPDGDGATNHFEYVAGLTPTNNSSRFNLRIESVPGRPEQKAIIFSPRVAGRTYTVKYKVSLTDPTWTPLTDIATNDNGIERTITDLSAGSGSRLYQVEITQP
jgi:alpha-tubulin suppressor-like RCC1 family protein